VPVLSLSPETSADLQAGGDLTVAQSWALTAREPVEACRRRKLDRPKPTTDVRRWCMRSNRCAGTQQSANRFGRPHCAG
jgi:hypothetical protein